MSSDILPKTARKSPLHIDEDETCNSPNPVDQEFQSPYLTKEIESVDRDTGGINEKAKLDLILEKLSNVPASTNDNTVLRKLDKYRIN